jgi:hypothetical protein
VGPAVEAIPTARAAFEAGVAAVASELDTEADPTDGREDDRA